MKRKRNRLLVPVLIASIVLSITMSLFVVPPSKAEAAVLAP